MVAGVYDDALRVSERRQGESHGNKVGGLIREDG